MEDFKMMEVIGSKVLIRPDKADEVSKGGIHLPDISKEKPSRGKVVKVGPGKYENGQWNPMQVLEGDTVFYSRTFAQPVKINLDDLVVIKEEDILVVVHK